MSTIKIRRGDTHEIDLSKDIVILTPYNTGEMGIEVQSDTVSCDIELLMSYTGNDMDTATTDWGPAICSTGDAIVETLAAGKTPALFTVSPVPGGAKFALRFSANTGIVNVTVKS